VYFFPSLKKGGWGGGGGQICLPRPSLKILFGRPYIVSVSEFDVGLHYVTGAFII
jgi:hypothetical protein